MPKSKFVALISSICLMSVIFYGLVGFSQSPKPTVRLTTEPASQTIFPFEAEAATPLGSRQPQSPVSFTLSAVDAHGKLLPAKIHWQLFAPSKNPFLSTDFPLVEGTKLLEMEAIAPTGELSFQQMLPIRGNYQLVVNVSPIANTLTPFQQNLQISVAEQSLKYRYFGILAAILLLVGLTGGLVIGGKQQLQPGEIAPQRVRLLLSGVTLMAIATLVAVNTSAELAHSSHEHHHHSPLPTNLTATRQSQGLEVRLAGDEHAMVGQAANLAVFVTDQTDQPVTDVLLKVTATQLEDNWVLSAYQSPPNARGQLIWQQQFFNGASHQVAIEVSPQPNAVRQFQPFQVAKVIAVEGGAPPLLARLIAFAYFTGFIVVGLLLGLWLKRHSTSVINRRLHES